MFSSSRSQNPIVQEGEELYAAVSSGDIERTTVLLDNGADIEQYTRPNNYTHYKTALHVAVDSENIEMVGLLLSRGANMEAYSYFNDSVTDRTNNALDKAVKTNNVSIVQLLIENGANVDANECHGFTALHKAAESGSAEVIQILLNQGADPMAKRVGDVTALHQAAEKGNVDAVITLLSHEKAVDMVNAQDEKGDMPLHDAVTGTVWADTIPRKTAIITALQQAGADMNAQNKEGETALHATVKGGKELAGVLCDLGVDPEIKNKHGKKAGQCGMPGSVDRQFIQQRQNRAAGVAMYQVAGAHRAADVAAGINAFAGRTR